MGGSAGVLTRVSLVFEMCKTGRARQGPEQMAETRLKRNREEWTGVCGKHLSKLPIKRRAGGRVGTLCVTGRTVVRWRP